MEIRIGIDAGSDTIKSVIIREEEIKTILPVKIKGKPMERVRELLSDIKFLHLKEGETNVKIGISGRGSEVFSDVLKLEKISETDAIAKSVNKIMPEIRHIIEIGAESQSYLSFYKNQGSDKLLLEDAITGGACAGGTGSFLDYMHKRLKYMSLDEFIKAGLSVDSPAGISGRCAVFAESDIVHHYQKGTPKERIVAGIHQAAARNYKSLIQKSKKPEDKIALIGGAAQNKCLAYHIAKELGYEEDQVVVPEQYLYLTAIGAAFRTEQSVDIDEAISNIEKYLAVPFDYASMSRMKLEKSIIMKPPEIPEDIKPIELASLGVDIGSVSTKAALVAKIKGNYHILASHYRRTEGNPIQAVQLTLKEILKEIESKEYEIDKIVAATTGSGRYLTAYFIGAGLIKDEITAQASGTATYLNDKNITIIEIGGQDSKFIELCNSNIADFEMNWACAAGTGALIEKHAKNLDIDIKEFGGIALKGEKPPIINSTCAVFSESALIHFQQNNVSVENLCAGACLASAKNYLVKVVRNRPISERIVFQGAVAFNRGMVGSFETLLDRPITVPPYPHLTGAIGVAKLALEEEIKNPGKPAFKGFKEIIDSEYSLTSFQCAHCNNECHVNTFIVGKERFYQGDRCDRYSSEQKKKIKSNLPNLFEEREQLLQNIYIEKELNKTAQTIGFPRGLFFSDYYPLFKAFFSELGFNVMASDKTNKKIISMGINRTVAEPCFPIKVAHGHVESLLEKDIDYIFLPAIISSESPIGKFDSCISCPYVQSAPDVIKSALDLSERNTRFISPTIFFNRGENHFKRVMREVGKSLGKNSEEIDRALKTAKDTHLKFKNVIKERGREVIENLKDKEMAFVVIARPYALYDSALNMDTAKKVIDEGYLPIPLDYLPIEEYDTSDSWPNIYSIQGQKKIAAARMIKERKNLHALVITYFGCGPDAFLDQMFKEEVERHYLTIQIDEHTSDTGMITRIQAYLNSVGQDNEKSYSGKKKDTKDKPITEIKGKRLWIPDMSKGSHVLASAMRAFGIDAHPLKRSSDPGISLARKYICGDVCLPMLHTSEDMLRRTLEGDFDPAKEAFFQGKSGGPCRYGMYFMLEKSIFDLLYDGVDIVTIGNKNNSGGLGTFFLVLVWDALVAHDMLEKMLLHTRPYEREAGASDAIFQKYISKLIDLVDSGTYSFKSLAEKVSALFAGNHLGLMKKIIREARLEFESQIKPDEKKPLVGVVGEFYVRFHEPSNQSIIKKIESLGAEVWLAPVTEFFGYSNYISSVHAQDRWKDEKKLKYLAEANFRRFIGDLAVRDEHSLFIETLPLLSGFDELTSRQIVEYGSEYVNKFFGGEAILSLGKAEDFARRNLGGIVNIGPFNCMPNLVVSAISRKLRQNHNNIPFLNMDYDGYEDSMRDIRISTFMSQVKERIS